MTTYVYETIPAKEGDFVDYFEIKQSMKDAPLTQHPETRSSDPARHPRRLRHSEVGEFLSCEQGQLWLRAGRMLRLKRKKYGSRNHISRSPRRPPNRNDSISLSGTSRFGYSRAWSLASRLANCYPNSRTS